MRDVYDYAKFFIQNGADSLPNTYDGNMKLQKLLVFADFISIAEYEKPLFQDNVFAFKNGCVVEKVRLRYKNDYYGLKRDSDIYQPDFTDNEYAILKLVLDVFGHASARELSEINHTFTFWKEAYANGTDADGYHNKSLSIVHMNDYKEDIVKMKTIIDAYKESIANTETFEVINGITFYYDGFLLDDSIIEKLEDFSLEAEDDTYSVYIDDGELVIY